MEVFLLIDLLLLSRGSGARTCAEQLEERLAWFWGGQWAALWASASGGRRSPKSTGTPNVKQTVARVHTLAAAGEEGRALAAASSSKPSPKTLETLSQVRTCFPTSTSTGDRPPAVAPQPDDDLSQAVQDEVQRLLKKPPRLTSPGLLGSRLEHLCIAVESEETFKLLAKATTCITFGALPADTLAALRVGEVVAFEKKDGGVRPLLVSSTLRRLGLRALVRVKKDQLQHAAGGHQYGVGRKSGAELLIRKLEAQAELKKTAVFLKIDLSAAFQRLERQPAIDAMAAKVPEVASVVATWYGRPVKHMWRDAAGGMHEVESTRGFDQGCPLAPAAFSIAQSAALESFYAELCQIDPESRMYSYLDDTYVVVQAPLAIVTLDALKQSLQPYGLHINGAKTAAWSPAGPSVCPEGLQEFYVPALPILGKHLRSRGDVEDCPAMIGCPEASLDSARARLVTCSQNLSRLQAAGLKKHAAGALLRTYAGAASQQALRQELATEDATALYDQQIVRCWEELLERNLGQTAKEILSLPTKLGGMGAQLADNRRFAAFFASWSAAAKEVSEDIGCSTIAGCLEHLPEASHKLAAAWQGLVQQGVRVADGGSLAEAVGQELRQGLATEKVQKTKHDLLLRRLPLRSQAELRGAGGPGSGAFLSYPSEAACAMENVHWQTACRRRLQLEQAECSQTELPSASTTCRLCTLQGAVCRQPLDSMGFHSLTCQCGGGVVRRHAAKARVVGSLVRRWRLEEPLMEQRVPSWDRQPRGATDIERAVLDIEYQDADGRRWLDVSVRHPAAGEGGDVRVAARRDGEASRRGERDKHSRYPGERLTPFIIEVGGRLGAEARTWLSSQLHELPQDIQHAERLRAYKLISCTLQTQVARQLRAAAGLK